MKKNSLIILIILLIVAIISTIFFLSQNNNANSNSASNSNQQQNSNIAINNNSNTNNSGITDIQVMQPIAGGSITSPVTVSGKAKGSWFFEAVFPVQIVDDEGNQLGYGNAQAVGDWQTDNFVDFTAQINFANGNKTSGFLVLQNDNPSGIKALEKELRVAVNFSIAENDEVKIFLGKESEQQSDCSIVSAVNRSIEKTSQIATAAINQLIAGPTNDEKTEGYNTNINSSTRLLSLNIDNGKAYADFSQELQNIAGSCAVQMVRAQIENTLKQFSTVQEVIISVDGKTEGILQP